MWCTSTERKNHRNHCSNYFQVFFKKQLAYGCNIRSPIAQYNHWFSKCYFYIFSSKSFFSWDLRTRARKDGVYKHRLSYRLVFTTEKKTDAMDLNWRKWMKSHSPKKKQNWFPTMETAAYFSKFFNIYNVTSIDPTIWILFPNWGTNWKTNNFSRRISESFTKRMWHPILPQHSIWTFVYQN